MKTAKDIANLDRNAVIGCLVREGVDVLDMQLYNEGLVDLEDMGWGLPANGRSMRRTIEMTIENRGAAVHLKPRQRLVWSPPKGEPRIWYGLDYRYIELRVWHDGSVSIEVED